MVRTANRLSRWVLLLVAGLATSGCLSENLIKQVELTVIPGAPAGWGATANTSGIGTTVSERHGGTTAAYLTSAFDVGAFATYQIVQAIRATDYHEKRVRLSAWVKPRNVANATFSGIWMRVDGPGVTLASDNMANRVVSGYGDWREISVVLDIPANAIGISFGAQFRGNNSLLVDDMRFEVVGTDVRSTNQLTAPVADGRDSATVAAAYAQRPSIPVNLDFEGLPPVANGTSSFIGPGTVGCTVSGFRTGIPGNSECHGGLVVAHFAYHLERVTTRRRMYVKPHDPQHQSVPGAG